MWIMVPRPNINSNYGIILLKNVKKKKNNYNNPYLPYFFSSPHGELLWSLTVRRRRRCRRRRPDVRLSTILNNISS